MRVAIALSTKGAMLEVPMSTLYRLPAVGEPLTLVLDRKVPGGR